MDSIDQHLDAFSDQSPSGLSPSQLKGGARNSYQKNNKEKKPKRNKSAFILFSIEQRAKFKSECQDQINSNEMMVKLAETWKQLPKEEREKFETEAKNDKMRYLREVEDFSKTHPDETIHNKTKKNHVKKPCSAYALFLKETKKVIKAEAPHLKMADVLKVVSEKWKNLSENERAVYQEGAKVEKDMVKALLDQKVLKESTKINTVRAASVLASDLAPAKKLCQEASKVCPEPTIKTEVKVEDQVKIEALNQNILQGSVSTSSSFTASDSYIKEEAGGFDEIAQRMLPLHMLNPSLADVAENQNKMLLNFFNSTFRKSTEIFSELLNASSMMRNPMSSMFNPFTVRNCQAAAPSRSKIINNVIISALHDTKESQTN